MNLKHIMGAKGILLLGRSLGVNQNIEWEGLPTNRRLQERVSKNLLIKSKKQGRQAQWMQSLALTRDREREGLQKHLNKNKTNIQHKYSKEH